MSKYRIEETHVRLEYGVSTETRCCIKFPVLPHSISMERALERRTKIIENVYGETTDFDEIGIYGIGKVSIRIIDERFRKTIMIREFTKYGGDTLSIIDLKIVKD